MSLVDSIRATFRHAMIARCRERRCELMRRGLKTHVVLKGERLCPDRKAPDCIIFIESDPAIIVIAELKSKTIHAGDIVEKLLNGSKVALAILKKCSRRRLLPAFYHLLLYKSCPPSEYKVIRDSKITVRGKRYDIIANRCGVSLSTIISSLE